MLTKNTRKQSLEEPKPNYNACDAKVATLDRETGTIQIDTEKQIEGYYDDYKTEALLELGVTLSPVIKLNDRGKLIFKDKIEKMAKAVLNKSNKE